MKLVISTLAALAVAAPAFAATSVAVRTSDLNLANPADAAIMLRRLDIAAAQACGAEKASVRVMQQAVRRSDCYAETMDRALTALNAPNVAAAYRDSAPLVGGR